MYVKQQHSFEQFTDIFNEDSVCKLSV